MGLVSMVNRFWSLTQAGNEEAQRIRQQLPERATKAIATANRLVEQGKLATPALGELTLDVVNPYTAVVESAKLTLGTVSQKSIQSLISSITSVDSLNLAQETVQPLLNAAARVDLLASTGKAIQSLARIVERVDSLTLAQETIQPLMNAATSVDLLASAQEAIQSVVSITGRFDPPTLTREHYQPLFSTMAKFDPPLSAQETIKPLMDAVLRFDSLVLAEEAIYPFANLEKEIHSYSLAQEAIQPLVSAAIRFDANTLGQESMQSLIKVKKEMDLFALAQEDSAVLASLTADYLSSASTLEIMSSPQLISALDSIKSISLKPSISEIAAGQAIQALGGYTQKVVADLYPQLTLEAWTSFSQSQRLSLASIEQLSALGDTSSSIIKEFSEANLGVREMISDLGTIALQGQNIKSNMVTLMSNVAEVARTYKGYLADVVGGLGESVVGHRIDMGIAVPTRTTSAYVGSVKTAVVVDEAGVEKGTFPEGYAVQWREKAAQLDDVFRGLGPNYIAMWHGGWMVLDSRSPDRIRQAAHSGRELLMQALAELAPDSAFDVAEVIKYGFQGKVTRKMRVKKILAGGSDSVVGWVEAIAKALEETYNRLAAVSHDRRTQPQVTEQQLAALLFTLGGLLSFIDEFQRNKTE
jgi:hypothetical protein